MPWEPTDEDVRELLRLLTEHDAAMAREFLRVLRGKGVTETDVWLRLVAPVARRLGELAARPDTDGARLQRTEEQLRQLVGLLERPGTAGSACPEPLRR